jgi:hypothetical protein
VTEKGPFGGQKYHHFVTFCDRKGPYGTVKNTGNTGKFFPVSVFTGLETLAARQIWEETEKINLMDSSRAALPQLPPLDIVNLELYFPKTLVLKNVDSVVSKLHAWQSIFDSPPHWAGLAFRHRNVLRKGCRGHKLKS